MPLLFLKAWEGSFIFIQIHFKLTKIGLDGICHLTELPLQFECTSSIFNYLPLDRTTENNVVIRGVVTVVVGTMYSDSEDYENLEN